MKTIYYTATSLDGFIATEDDSLEWLFRLGDGNDTSYTRFIAQIGALAMGSSTYEWMLRNAQNISEQMGSAWPYVQPCWVFTHRSLPGYFVMQLLPLSRFARLGVLLVITLVIVLIAVNFQAHLLSRNYALSRAHAKVSQVCALGGRDPGLLIFKNEQTVGNTAWSFEWIHPAAPSYLYGACISSSGAI